MIRDGITALTAELDGLRAAGPLGRVSAVEAGLLRVTGLEKARMGDRLEVSRTDGGWLAGEVLQLAGRDVLMLPDGSAEGTAIGDAVRVRGGDSIAPADGWIGRVVDPFGMPLDGAPLLRGAVARPLRAAPPDAAARRRMGARLETGLRAFNTLLPVARGQRLGLFAGAGVGKSSLLAHFARAMQADVVVLALIGERGRELRDFVEDALGAEGMARAVVVTATSDRSALVRRRCAWAAMAVAEHFRDQGRHVLLLADSITRFAEAHREVAVAAGEPPALRGHPPSTAHQIMSLAERAGPGPDGAGDITALFSVLVAGSDHDEPVADILRGVLDGHVVLDRAIAERGRFPAVDLVRSVSRSLPGVASAEENAAIARARSLVAAYEGSETMIRAGLYAEGSDPLVDQAVRVWPELDAFLAETEREDTAESFRRLRLLLRRAEAGAAARTPAVT
ncbi:FliI/YscN family ATPase [Rhodosalinus sp. 5P4]|uniref:FliI/YscN family ATPase n=1 Tax=Rhodosalinus sp. 5P4 TaxID=3239196 RepID=UPI003525934E